MREGRGVERRVPDEALIHAIRQAIGIEAPEGEEDEKMDKVNQLIEEEGEPFVPQGVQKDVVFAGIVLLALFFCAAFFGPSGPNGEPDPTLIDTVPRPDFWYLPLFAVFALLPPYMETTLMLLGPVVLIALAVLLHEGSTVVVVFNALRLLAFRD